MSKASPYDSRSEGFDRTNRHERFRELDRERNRLRDRDRERERHGGRSGENMPKQTAYDVNEHPFELRHEVKRLNGRLDKIADSLERANFKDIVENYMSPKKRIITNFTAGLARGLGMTVGTVVVLSLLGYILSLFVDMPLIGDYIAELQGYIDKAR
ncbi:DUF5665 domain-containing protein [Paenibacillus sp. DMB20]|uniref:DUF5665 domain-containing protein n=1 Tax=Paenibacillus sp. DMB20 TaxID=1642570 RepID=UPI000B114880|nr:DUF5665 domain-containing protein [Paenibacillus sp. DMB20]